MAIDMLEVLSVFIHKPLAGAVAVDFHGISGLLGTRTFEVRHGFLMEGRRFVGPYLLPPNDDLRLLCESAEYIGALVEEEITSLWEPEIIHED